MVCAGACFDMVETIEYAPYNTGAKCCSDCTIYLFTDSVSCPCCHKRLRTKPKKRLPPHKRTFTKYFFIMSRYDTLKDDLLTLDEVILGRIFHT